MRIRLHSVCVVVHDISRALLHWDSSSRKMEGQAFLTILMLSMTLANLLQAVTHEELIVACGEDRCWNVNKDGDPRVMVVGESCKSSVSSRTMSGLHTFASKEYGCDDSCAQISCKVGGDRDIDEAPDHYFCQCCQHRARRDTYLQRKLDQW